jgi:Ser/Thr protein kinase RdoA (MazF antagonist)
LSDYVNKVYQQEIVHEALAGFGVRPGDVSPPILGSNAVVRVTSDQGEFALRLHRVSRDASRIEAELAFVSALESSGNVVVPRPVATMDGSYCLSLATTVGAVNCSLLTWLPGMSRLPGQGLGASRMYCTGLALARVHQFSRSRDYESEQGFSRFRLSSMLEKEREQVSSRWPELDQIVLQMEVGLAGLIGDSGAPFVIHGDFILKNLLYYGRSVHVLDFDDCTFDYFPMDFAGMLENLDGYRGHRQLTSALLDGYTAGGEDASIVANNIPLLVALRHYAGLNWAVGMREEKRITDAFFHRVTTHRKREIQRLMGA